MAVAWIANAAPKTQAVVEVSSTPQGKLVAVIPGERELLWLLVMNGAFIIWTLVKDYWANHKKKTDTSAEDILEIKKLFQGLAHTVGSMKDHLDEVPTEKEVRLMIYEMLHKKEQK